MKPVAKLVPDGQGGQIEFCEDCTTAGAIR
jgi:hypothetical protein